MVHPNSVSAADATSDGAPGAAAGAVALLDGDPDFAEAIPHADLPLAHRVLHLPRVDVETGPWQVPALERWRGPVTGLVVMEGALCRDVTLADRVATQFLGPGDVLRPWSRAADGLPCTERYSAHVPTMLAVLDGRFALSAAKWPALTALVVARMADQVARVAIHTAIAQLPRVEQRVLAMMWQLAERFGRVSAEGVIVDLRLTHALIGQCVGARRPTVTLALRALQDDGLLTRRADGSWSVDPDSRSVLECPAPVSADAA